MIRFPADVTHHLERMILDIIEWKGAIRRIEIVRRLNDQYARTTVLEALQRLLAKGYVDRKEVKHGGIGRPHTYWNLTIGRPLQGSYVSAK